MIIIDNINAIIIAAAITCTATTCIFAAFIPSRPKYRGKSHTSNWIMGMWTSAATATTATTTTTTPTTAITTTTQTAIFIDTDIYSQSRGR